MLPIAPTPQPKPDHDRPVTWGCPNVNAGGIRACIMNPFYIHEAFCTTPLHPSLPQCKPGEALYIADTGPIRHSGFLDVPALLESPLVDGSASTETI